MCVWARAREGRFTQKTNALVRVEQMFSYVLKLSKKYKTTLCVHSSTFKDKKKEEKPVNGGNDDDEEEEEEEEAK